MDQINNPIVTMNSRSAGPVAPMFAIETPMRKIPTRLARSAQNPEA